MENGNLRNVIGKTWNGANLILFQFLPITIIYYMINLLIGLI